MDLEAEEESRFTHVHPESGSMLWEADVESGVMQGVFGYYQTMVPMDISVGPTESCLVFYLTIYPLSLLYMHRIVNRAMTSIPKKVKLLPDWRVRPTGSSLLSIEPHSYFLNIQQHIGRCRHRTSQSGNVQSRTNASLPLHSPQLQRQMQHTMTKLPSLRKFSSPNIHLQRRMQ